MYTFLFIDKLNIIFLNIIKSNLPSSSIYIEIKQTKMQGALHLSHNFLEYSQEKNIGNS